MVLGQSEVEACREAFDAFDTNNSGEIDAWELRDILKGLGKNPTDVSPLRPPPPPRPSSSADRSCSRLYLTPCIHHHSSSSSLPLHYFHVQEELFELISLVDTNMSGTIDFAEFIAVINFQKENAAKDDGAREIVFAFTACGGNSDKSGFVKTDRVVHVVKEIFKLHYDIQTLMDSLDDEEEGQIDFEKFRSIFA